ncbi:serine hydrolase domain-containing protein [Flavobacterium sp.]|uniref:serine hydrolase domain-containing protein n=1 Tax=Flavobacterium sp. TaxID=239 RepID=UPI00262EBF29|nr:serine hydrolase domain-containing protein [Flavobacterium sp.]
MSRFVLKIILLSLAVICFDQSTAQTKKIKEVESSLIPYVPIENFPKWNLQERMKFHKIPGASIAVIDNYKVVWSKSYGYADTLTNRKVNNRTLFSAGSVSKMILGIVIMNLVEEGKLDLDTPVNAYLKSWQLKSGGDVTNPHATLRMLLSHTAGTSQSSYFGFTDARSTYPTIVEILSGAPGTGSNPVVQNSEQGKFRYSGGGSLIAQLVASEVTGKSFDELAIQFVFNKLKLQRTNFQQPLNTQLSNNVALGYSAAPWFVSKQYVYPQLAAAGLNTTATDLATILAEMMKAEKDESQILSRQSFETMTQPVAEVSSGTYLEQTGTGLFLLRRTDSWQQYFEHQGVNAGYVTYAFGSLKLGKGVVIMLNSGDDFNGFAAEVRRAVAKSYQWPEFLPEPIKMIPKSKSELQRYVGRYRKGDNEVIYLTAANGYLIERINTGKEIPLVFTSENEIVFSDYNVKGQFKISEKGVATGLKYDWEQTYMPRMLENEFTLNELIEQQQFEAAEVEFLKRNFSENDFNYFIYNYLSAHPKSYKTCVALAEIGLRRLPNSAVLRIRKAESLFKLNLNESAINELQTIPKSDYLYEEAQTLIRKNKN